MKKLNRVSPEYFLEYSRATTGMNIDSAVRDYDIEGKISKEDFEYYFVASSLFSSKIEGNTLDADSFFRNRKKLSSPKKKEVQEVETLMEAYEFAYEHPLTKKNFLLAHGILSKTLLPKSEQGKLRTDEITVRDRATMRIAYMGTEAIEVRAEFDLFFSDIAELLTRPLTNKEVFYYASMLHIWLAKIHPFGDGNGRSARLLEKWFLVSKLGSGAWTIYSEKYYWDNRPDYYQNISLGFNYYALHWERCMPFLLMLPKALLKI